jgi:hypothetical protein
MRHFRRCVDARDDAFDVRFYTAGVHPYKVYGNVGDFLDYLAVLNGKLGLSIGKHVQDAFYTAFNSRNYDNQKSLILWWRKAS